MAHTPDGAASPRPRRARDEPSRDALLAAGWRCWATRGYQEITVDDICREAGVAKGTFYLSFRTKADFLAAMLAEDAAAMEAQVIAFEATSPSSLGRLVELARVTHCVTADRAHAQVRLDIQRELAVNPMFSELFGVLLARRRDRVVAWIEAGIAAGEIAPDVDAAGMASAYLALLTGIAAQIVTRDESFAWPRLGEAVRRMLRGFATN